MIIFNFFCGNIKNMTKAIYCLSLKSKKSQFKDLEFYKLYYIIKTEYI